MYRIGAPDPLEHPQSATGCSGYLPLSQSVRESLVDTGTSGASRVPVQFTASRERNLGTNRKTQLALFVQIEYTTQDSCVFYKSQAVLDSFGGVVLSESEGARIAEKLGDNKLIILQNHGLLYVNPPPLPLQRSAYDHRIG